MAKKKHEYHEISRGTLVTEGLTFYPEKHEYFYNGKKLSGITGTVGKKLKRNYDCGHVEEGRMQGSHVHEAIEAFIKTGKIITVHPAANWAIKELEKIAAKGRKIYSEVLVSDFDAHATACDILVLIEGTNDVILCDTKAGEFKRDYVTLQLSIEKMMIEETTDYRVKEAYCISTRDREFYPIFFKRKQEMKALLYPVKVTK